MICNGPGCAKYGVPRGNSCISCEKCDQICADVGSACNVDYFCYTLYCPEPTNVRIKRNEAVTDDITFSCDCTRSKSSKG